MGLKSKRKGRRAEQELVRLARQHGLRAVRTWQTSQSSNPTERRCDVLLEGRPVQVKMSADGFGQLYSSLEALGEP